MIFFADIECSNNDCKGLKDVARILRVIADQADQLANQGKDKENIVEPVLTNDGSKVGEWEWIIDKNGGVEHLSKKWHLPASTVEALVGLADKYIKE